MADFCSHDLIWPNQGGRLLQPRSNRALIGEIMAPDGDPPPSIDRMERMDQLDFRGTVIISVLILCLLSSVTQLAS